MSTDSRFPDVLATLAPTESVAAGFPSSTHAAEGDLFLRQVSMPGHNQAALEAAHIGLVGGGGLGSWIGVGLARLGIRRLTVFDGDRFDRSNAPRQLMYPGDLHQPKAVRLADNLRDHMTNAGRITAFPRKFAANDATGLDLLIVGVDNNRTRLVAAQEALSREIPAVFCMLSSDGLRAQVFLQTPGAACLSCVLPNLDPNSQAPCAAASLASCFLAASHTLQFAVAALSAFEAIPTWRETSLDGTTERASRPARRADCHVCGAVWTSTSVR